MFERAKAVTAPPRSAAPPAPSSARVLLGRLASVDFTRPVAAAALGVVYIGSRLPWITLGYGADPDTSRVAISAR